jgi:hypothetical protein
MASSIIELRCREKYYIEDQSWRREESGQPTADFSYKTKLYEYTPRTEDIRIKHWEIKETHLPLLTKKKMNVREQFKRKAI